MQQCIRDSAVQINMKLEAPLVFSNGFLFTRHFRIQCVIPNEAQCESYSFMPCRMVYLRHFETLEFVQRMTPKGNTDALDKAYLATMKCTVVNKAFKQVAEEHTKIKQVKHQLKALERGSEHAGQTADALE